MYVPIQHVHICSMIYLHIQVMYVLVNSVRQLYNIYSQACRNAVSITYCLPSLMGLTTIILYCLARAGPVSRDRLAD